MCRGSTVRGRLIESTVADFSVGDSVLVTGYDLGSGAWGGYSAEVRVPAGVGRVSAEDAYASNSDALWHGGVHGCPVRARDPTPRRWSRAR